MKDLIKFIEIDYLPEVSYIPTEHLICLGKFVLGSIKENYKEEAYQVDFNFSLWIDGDTTIANEDFGTLEEAKEYTYKILEELKENFFP